MRNFKQDIIDAVGDDTIIAVKIDGTMPDYGEPEPRFKAANECTGKLLSYNVALALLNYDYDSGYGSQDCHTIIMWSKNYVYYIHEYDGSTSIESLERNPQMLS